jgi:hypothetical protein
MMEAKSFDQDIPTAPWKLFANNCVELAAEKFVSSQNDFSCLKGRMLRALRFGNPFRAYRNTEFLKSKKISGTLTLRTRCLV